MTTNPRIFALVVAAGTGIRAGGALPKQYQIVGGKAILTYSVETLASHTAIAGVQVVIHPDHAAYYDEAVRQGAPLSAGRGTPAAPLPPELLPPVFGGRERSDSVRAGLAALAIYAPDHVLIHDAARPFLSHAMIDALIENPVTGYAVLPALPVADTVRRLEGGKWHEVSRDGLLRIQTPQFFPYARLRKMIEKTAAGAIVPPPSKEVRSEGEFYIAPAAPTDEAAVWLAAGAALRYVAGDEELRKVTTAEDLMWAEKKITSTRRVAVGMGYDVHALMPSGDAGVIRLGGIDIAHGHKLHGHSDADVVLHAIVDALLGAVAAGDIGLHFPPGDASLKDENSAVFIEEARAQVALRGGVISHVDVTVICEAPKISPHRDAMRAAIAALLKLPPARVSVKATTTEKLGMTGRGEGIACQAIATVTLPEEA